MRLLTMAWLLLIVTHIASGQAAIEEKPKPGPEVQKLAYFTYQAEASIDNGPWTMIAESKVTKVK